MIVADRLATRGDSVSGRWEAYLQAAAAAEVCKARLFSRVSKTSFGQPPNVVRAIRAKEVFQVLIQCIIVFKNRKLAFKSF